VLTGKRFKLERATLGVGQIDGKRRTVTIPVGAILKVVSEANRDGLLSVNWDNQILDMFEIDVDVRGSEIREGSAKA
jgi:hypothetical protein